MALSPIEPSDILPLEFYEHVRERWSPMILRHKRARRVELGHLCVLFESRETVLWQIHEVLRVESRWTPEQIQREIDEYGTLLPWAGHLSATVTIQSGSASVGATLSRELGEGRLSLEIGSDSYPCRPQRPGDEPDAVHYLSFELPSDCADALTHETCTLLMRSSLGHHRAWLSPSTCASLIETLDELEPFQFPPSGFRPLTTSEVTWPSW